ncbi:MAG: DUF2116 family Zn-ribbon domain-containing protein [Thermoplasmata archaeon]|nr:DUF2116 family Zn-ribbon domain-containing protein [Thermoplasmata archaeon]
MVAPIDHRHCKVCGKVCAGGSETCSAACERERTRRLTARRNYSLLLYAAIALVALVFLISQFRI